MMMVSCVDVAARPPVVMLVIWYRLLLTVAVLGSSFLGTLFLGSSFLGSSLLGRIGYEKEVLNTNKSNSGMLESCNV